MPANASEHAHPTLFCMTAGSIYGGAGGLLFCISAGGYNAIVHGDSLDSILSGIELGVIFGIALGAVGGFLGGLIAGLISNIYGFAVGGMIGGTISGLIFAPLTPFTGAFGTLMGLCIGYMVFYNSSPKLPMLAALREALSVAVKDEAHLRNKRRIGWLLCLILSTGIGIVVWKSLH